MIIPHHESPKKAVHSARSSKHSRGFLIAAICIGALLAILIGIRAVLPHYILQFANRKLDQIPEYKGHIDDVDLAIIRGAYKIKGIKLEKIAGASREPFFSATALDFSVEWRALFHRSLVGEVEVFEPKVNFVVAATKKQSQTSIDTSWEDRCKEMFPLQLNRIRIHDGEIHFRDLTRAPKVNIHLDQLEAEAVGLTNHPGKGEALPATVHISGRAMNEANLRVDIRLDPLAANPTFDMDAELKQLKLTTLNDFLEAYAKIDAKGGTFSLYTEMAADHGSFKGYVKPLLKDVKIFAPGEKKESILQNAWEAVVAGVESVFENHQKQQLATQIPLSGKFANPKAGIIPSVTSLLRNAFIQALHPDLTHSISFQDVNGGKPTKGAGTVKPEDLKKDEKAGEVGKAVKTAK